MQHVAKVCADQLVAQGIVSENDREIYVYGLEVSLSAGGFTLMALLFGLVLGLFAEVLVFLLAFMPIRCFIGGYHADTPGTCLLLSLFVSVSSINIGLWLNQTALPPLLILTALILIFWLAPVIHPSHPHTAVHRLRLKKRARVIAIVECTSILIAQMFIPELAAIMAMAFFAACLGMPLAVWRGCLWKVGDT